MEDNKSGKFDSWVDKGIFVGYSWKSKTCKCYNLILKKIVEIIYVKFDESNLLKTKREKKNPDMLDDKMNIELRQEEEEEEEEEKKDEKQLEKG